MGYRNGPQGYGWYNGSFRTDGGYGGGMSRSRRRGRASAGQNLLGFLIFCAIVAGGLFFLAHHEHESVTALLRSFTK